MKTVLITGAAGFIGFHLSQKLLSEGYRVIGVDNINDYYEVSLKEARLKELGIEKIVDNEFVQSKIFPNFRFCKLELAEKSSFDLIKDELHFVIHLAAQAGVRYSLINPDSYITRNIVAFNNILEFIKDKHLENFLFASSSSVYGLNADIPFEENQKTDSPVSLYAATKKSNELLAHAYSYLFKIPSTGLRFFTVYGPWGRPDMFPFILADSITKDKTINLYANGELKRDYTYVGDIVESIARLLTLEVKKNSNGVQLDIFNIGNSNPIKNREFVSYFEKRLGKKAIINIPETPKTELDITYANVSKLESKTGYKPMVSAEDGVNQFLDWYLKYYEINLAMR